MSKCSEWEMDLYIILMYFLWNLEDVVLSVYPDTFIFVFGI